MNLNDPDFEWKHRKLPLKSYVFPELDGGFLDTMRQMWYFKDGTCCCAMAVMMHNDGLDYERKKRIFELEEAGVKIGIPFLSMQPLGGGF